MKNHIAGFTLIELSIVLVIIGLIVGSVLVGRDLISSATVRAQITQIEGFETAANTFRVKYGFYPGDMPTAQAEAAGFYRDSPANDTGCLLGYGGCGNGDGIIGATADNFGNPLVPGEYQDGEPHLFWLDLSMAHLIKYNTKTYLASLSTTTAIADYIPPAAIANQFVYAWGGGISAADGKNYLSVSGVSQFCGRSLFTYQDTGCGTSRTMMVSQANAIDRKMDDGFPQSGSVLAMFLADSRVACGVGVLAGGMWAGFSDHFSGATICWGPPTTQPVAGDSTTCYDNNSESGAPQKYSMGQNGGGNRTCALSFRF